MTTSARQTELKNGAALFAALLMATGCGRGFDILTLTYNDEIVEAPTNTVEIYAVKGTDCDVVLGQLHNEIPESEILAKATVSFPVDPNSGVLDAFPQDEPFSLEIVGLDRSGQQIGRACTPITLDSGEAKEINLQLRTLPDCKNPPQRLDIQIVLDTSFQMSIVDPERLHQVELMDTFLSETSFAENTTFGLVTFGHQNGELVPGGSSLVTVRDQLAGLFNAHAGETAPLFDAIAVSTASSRSRAVCGVRSVMLVIVGNEDSGSSLQFEDARIGISSTQGDFTDDIFTYGIALAEGGFLDMNDLVQQPPEGAGTCVAPNCVCELDDAGFCRTVGNVDGVGPAIQFRPAFQGARDGFSVLLSSLN